MKFIHTSDWQLGMTRWFLTGEDGDAQARFSAARLAAIDRIGEVAFAEDADFIVVAGDVFDSNTLPARDVGRAMERLRSLPVPVYLLPGNHDAYDASSIYRRDPFPQSSTSGDGASLVVLKPGENVVTHKSGRGTVEIVGIPLTSKVGDPRDFEETLADLQPIDHPRIVVAHGQVEGFGGDADASLSLEAAETAVSDGLVQYIAVGDSHSTRQLDSRGYMWFSGAHETTDYDDVESDSGNVLVVEIDGTSAPVVAKHKVGEWEFQAHTRDFADFAEVEEWLEQLELLPNKDRTSIKYSLFGTVTLAQKADFDRRLAALAPVFAAVYKRASGSDLTVRPEDGDIAAMGVSGFALAAAEELQQISDNPDLSAADRTAAVDALGLLARIVGGN